MTASPAKTGPPLSLTLSCEGHPRWSIGPRPFLASATSTNEAEAVRPDFRLRSPERLGAGQVCVVVVACKVGQRSATDRAFGAGKGDCRASIQRALQRLRGERTRHGGRRFPGALSTARSRSRAACVCITCCGSGERCAPPAASRCSAARSAPSRGDPPLNRRARKVSPTRSPEEHHATRPRPCQPGTQIHDQPSPTNPSVTRTGLRDVLSRRLSGGSPREGALRAAEQRLAAGGAQRSPDPELRTRPRLLRAQRSPDPERKKK